jgi:glycosidase
MSTGDKQIVNFHCIFACNHQTSSLMFRILFLSGIIAAMASCSSSGHSQKKLDDAFVASPNNEVIYHVVQRSFYDSNGDLHGDLKGLTQKLDYLQELGITSVLMLPLYESVYYHNYFTGDFEKIDEEFGTKDDYLNLVKEMHRRGMKLYMDMETQYVTEDHLWYKDSYNNPASPYSDYLVYNGPHNTQPESIIFNLTELKGYNGVTKKITTINLNSQKVRDYCYGLYKHWVDPNGDGKFDDGVDGFRLDHMMDDLDNKGKWTHLFENFWQPLITKLKAVNPKISFVAEQADWGSLGLDYLTRGGVDRVFAFRIAFEIRNFNKTKLAAMADSIFTYTPQGKQQIVFIENHDMPRFAYVAKHDPGKLRVGAALNLLIGGIPSVYYGQELGMYGAGEWSKWGMTDANEIPDREAFEWFRSDSGKGMALWYKNSGPWWDQTNLKPDDGISLEEERPDSNSLWNFYRKMIRLRRTNSSLVDGAYQTLANDNDSVFSFSRHEKNKGAIVVLNLSGAPQQVSVDFTQSKLKLTGPLQQLWGNEKAGASSGQLKIALPPYAIEVWEVKE